jgi:hypothetical protein
MVAGATRGAQSRKGFAEAAGHVRIAGRAAQVAIASTSERN